MSYVNGGNHLINYRMSRALKHNPTKKDTKALKALIVDDLKFNRSLARIILERNNFETQEAENGVEALLHFEGQKPDVILMDICMPVMGGIEAMRKIRKLNRGNKVNSIPIIAFTSGEHKESRSDLMNQGFSEYLKKPFNEEDLFDKLSQFLPVKKSAS
ncbi:response regulator [Gracilimonas sediminicola]|uniref:Response regulator n=1 Tax=Gracilimonas sediminicola TaxID=2952158 RepID=A0A9X2L5T4_9BACT|nr:response regulator [Gracilimonas sediminicola]MCP9292876.1 response regulator [Gracilimonas sediminicola]